LLPFLLCYGQNFNTYLTIRYVESILIRNTFVAIKPKPLFTNSEKLLKVNKPTFSAGFADGGFLFKCFLTIIEKIKNEMLNDK